MVQGVLWFRFLCCSFRHSFWWKVLIYRGISIFFFDRTINLPEDEMESWILPSKGHCTKEAYIKNKNYVLRV